jgi:hypothetical protein
MLHYFADSLPDHRRKEATKLGCPNSSGNAPGGAQYLNRHAILTAESAIDLA